MAAGLRAVLEIADLIDAVVEVRDARVIRSTAVASMHRRLQSKQKFVLLNRCDLASQTVTEAWLRYFQRKHSLAYASVGTSSKSLHALRARLATLAKRRARVRVAVVGAPNTGKSSVINALARRKRAVAQNRPGVTKQIQWLALNDRVDVLDTPGVLEPRISDKETAWKLGLCGILPESAFDIEDAAEQFITWAATHHDKLGEMQITSLESFGTVRGMLRRRGELDRLNAARALIKEFRTGKLGRISFERPKFEN